MKKTKHYRKLEKRYKKITRDFRKHEKSKDWNFFMRISSNKIHLKIVKTTPAGYKLTRKTSIGLKDKLNLNTFLK